MDPLRLTLILVGVAIVIGIYWWGRKRGARKDAVPVLLDDVPMDEAFAVRSGKAALEEWDGGGFSARSEPESLDHLAGMETAEPGDLEPGMVAVLTVMSTGAPFAGTALMASVQAAGLHYSKVGVFHYYPDLEGVGGEPWFGVANVLEPGMFELEAMADIETPGVVFFMQLPGPDSALIMYERFLAVAETFAAQLGGQLCNERREPLDEAGLTALRERVRAQDALSANADRKSA